MQFDFDFLRQQTVGSDATITTPFGERQIVYCDYTASGRCLQFVENYLLQIQKFYANTHTEDDLTGRTMSRLLHESESYIKSVVNAGPNGRIIAVGTGATGAIDKLQQILGVACSPSTRNHIFDALGDFLGHEPRRQFECHYTSRRPIVFVGPYEHHSNEIAWRQGMATVVKVKMASDGGIDLDDLERLLCLPQYQGRLRIGSFSAASNVSGIPTNVVRIAEILHSYDAIACFDYAASAPYDDINMNPQTSGDTDPSIDAIYVSPHKFLGGAGSSGLLVFNEHIYNKRMPPSVAAGGTVDYVGPVEHDFFEDVEEREKPGTPGILQVLRAALAFKVKQKITSERIERREQELLSRAMQRWTQNPNIEILGNPNPKRRIGIVSFNIRAEGRRVLHPKFVTVLLNDLFGIQSRAGCSCAGPYGHCLLEIDDVQSERYRRSISEGNNDIKPGWCRIGFHYTMDDAEAVYVIDAVEFVANHGASFLPLYRFDLKTGDWRHENSVALEATLSLDDALRSSKYESTSLGPDQRQVLYRDHLARASILAEELGQIEAVYEQSLLSVPRELQYFPIRRYR